MSRSASQAFGREIADRLAALAIDIACDAPERLVAHDTKVQARLIQEARAVLEDAGVDWKKLVRSRIAREIETYERVRAAELARRQA